MVSARGKDRRSHTLFIFDEADKKDLLNIIDSCPAEAIAIEEEVVAETPAENN